MDFTSLYSLTAGKKIGKMHLLEKFYPLPFENDFIVCQFFSKPSKNYSYWGEVLSILAPILEKSNLKLVQVGDKSEAQMPYCLHTQGTTNFGQLQYLIGKSRLVLTVDSISSHIAGAKNKDLVCLVSNNFSEVVRPHFGDRNRQIILEPNRENRNPSFMLDEGPKKQIDEILPEKIAESVCSLLNLPFTYQNKTLFIGDSYKQKIIQSVPNHVIPDLKPLGIDSLVMRLDYLFNEEILVQQLKYTNCTIITNRPINIDILKFFKQKINQLIYIIEKDNSPEFAKSVFKLGINLGLMSYESQEWINSQKINYFEYGILFKKDAPKPPENLDTLKYKSSIFTLSDKKIYPSFSALKNNLPINDFNHDFQPVINDENFKKDLEYFYLVK